MPRTGRLLFTVEGVENGLSSLAGDPADKIHIVFTQGQTDFVMLLGFACVLRWMERRPWLAGLAIGFIANIKYVSLIFVPYFLTRELK